MITKKLVLDNISNYFKTHNWLKICVFFSIYYRYSNLYITLFFREAARECRRKKKEYIKCLENRVSVLENQNKALIEELKALKELYCQTKTE